MTRDELLADCRRDAEQWMRERCIHFFHSGRLGYIIPDKVVGDKLAELMADKAELMVALALRGPRCPTCGMLIFPHGVCLCVKQGTDIPCATPTASTKP